LREQTKKEDMTPLFQMMTIAVTIIACYTFLIIRERRKQKKEAAESVIDDVSYIQEIKHLSGKVGFVTWQQYDILLAAQKYGWETMVDLAAYLETADIDHIDSLAVADMPDEQATELVHLYKQSKGGLKTFDKLAEEKGMLSIAGHSRALKKSVKLVWFNQTRVLRLFTLVNDETLIRRYVETVIRRTFGTKDAMKLAKAAE
jgi:preprotein translocase subunit YajC